MLSRLVRSSKTLASIPASPQVRNLFSKQGNLATSRHAINDAADPRQAMRDATDKIRQEMLERKKQEEAIKVICGMILANAATNFVYDSVFSIRDWVCYGVKMVKERRAKMMEILAKEEQLASTEQPASTV